MAKKKIDIDKYASGLFLRTEQYADKVRQHYATAVDELLKLSANRNISPDELFSFSDNKKLSEKANNVLRGLYSAVYNEIKGGVMAEWEFANLSCDALIESIFGKGLNENNHFARWFSRNQEAMDAFFKRKSQYGGMNLSQKVWRYTGDLKTEMELALSLSLGQGDSASTVSRKVRQYLQEPDKLFRRIKTGTDANGNPLYKLSKAAKAYHPGRGVYRSSYKNAMRLTRTETNMAYRASEQDRWQRMDFVVGYEVKTSNNHPTHDICDELKGKYPKDFVFRGWHAQCRCVVVPILATDDEFIKMQEKILAGEDVQGFKSSRTVDDVPGKFNEWLKNNEIRLNNAKSIPYFLKGNPKFSGVVAPFIDASSRYSGTKLGRSATKAAYKEYEDALPPTLSAEQTANINEIAKEMGVNATPMSFLDADSGRGNIHFGKGTLYEENCQCCVAVHEARLRGLNLTAIAYSADANSIQWHLGEHFEDIWINPRTKKKPVVQKIKGANDNDILQSLEKQMQSSGRYHIGVNFIDGRGHVITAERLKSGKVIYYDAQSGEFLNIREYAALESVELLKVDKLLFNKSMLRAISELLK